MVGLHFKFRNIGGKEVTYKASSNIILDGTSNSPGNSYQRREMCEVVCMYVNNSTLGWWLGRYY